MNRAGTSWLTLPMRRSSTDERSRGLGLAISAGFVLFSSAAILYQTSEIIHGGERNYIMATISLYVSIYNLFVSLLQIFGIMGSDD